ncbi:MAG: NADH-quinone oxidoreductase subunit A [Fidelibacterota bacterium]|nr:MAG: NADH-quinone oxidoreductase subunit A [Candidatus Neomarinimicrobiota bacterium]
MISDYLPVLVVFFVAAGMAVAFLALTHIIGPRVKDKVKLAPYESGVDPLAPSHPRLSIRYFIIGLIFVIFDIEIVFLYPWAVVFKDFISSGPFILFEMLFFLVVLLFGFVYVWRKGVFEWE